uniref:Plasmodium vivax Vir protein n=1 Tax=Rhabditophanes sp. KR3021 TaxID=114890 RepID=A0AC35TY22_9BILA
MLTYINQYVTKTDCNIFVCKIIEETTTVNTLLLSLSEHSSTTVNFNEEELLKDLDNLLIQPESDKKSEVCAEELLKVVKENNENCFNEKSTNDQNQNILQDITTSDNLTKCIVNEVHNESVASDLKQNTTRKDGKKKGKC